MMKTALKLPRSVQLDAGRGGLPRLEIASPLARAQVYLHGAQITQFAPTGGGAILFESERARFEPGKAIRGGAPVIFPWFGPHPEGEDKPAHGFARTREWTLESATEEDDGTVVLVLRLEPDEEAVALWPEGGRAWTLRHRLTLGTALTMELEIENGGPAPFRCEEALHTYFRVGDIREVALHGLEETEYLTVIEDQPRKREGSGPIRFTGETDRIYVNTEANLSILDPVLHRRIEIEKSGSRATVVWNPWIAKSQRLTDFVPDEWIGMLCVETGNLRENALVIPPGERHVTRTVLREEV